MSHFEYNGRVAALPGEPLSASYRALWEKMGATCDAQRGVLSEFHDGRKQMTMNPLDTKQRLYAYATCRTGGAGRATYSQVVPISIQTLTKAGQPGASTMLRATGNAAHAQMKIRKAVLETCLAADERVRFMSLHSKPISDGRTSVTAHFACTTAADGMSPLSEANRRHGVAIPE